MQAQSNSDSLEVVLHALPEGSDSKFMRMAKSVQTQIERVLAHLEVTGRCLLSPIETRRGGQKHQGIRAQMYTMLDANRPCVRLVAQTESNDTCWLWQLQFPAGIDPMLMYAKIAGALEEGWHMADRPKVETNVVPLRSDPPVSSKPPIEPVADTSLVLRDESWMSSLLACVFSKLESSGHGKTLAYAVVLNEIMTNLGVAYGHKGAVLVVESFVSRGWFKKNKDGKSLTFGNPGLLILQSGGVDVSDLLETPIATAAAPLPLAPSAVSSPEEIIRTLKMKARKHAEALAKFKTLEQKEREQKQQIDDVAEQLRVLRVKLGETSFELDDARATLADPESSKAHAELERLRLLLSEGDA